MGLSRGKWLAIDIVSWCRLCISDEMPHVCSVSISDLTTDSTH